MENFRIRRGQTSQWKHYGPSSVRTSGSLRTTSQPGSGLGSTKTGTGLPQAFETPRVRDKNSVMMSVAGCASLTSQRHPGPAGRMGKRSQRASVSEADKLFKLRLVEKCAEQVMKDTLKDVTYDASVCRDMSPEVASAIIEKMKQFSLQQYKLVCVVSLGSLKEKPGVQFGSRCLWNKETDNFVSVRYTNGSLYAVAMIFGMYFD